MNDTKICTGCGYVITSKYLSLNGEDWHSTCVLCDECDGPVFTEETARFHTQDGKIFCKDCVTQLFQVCADCGQPAKKYVKALGKIWHTFHFKCASCKSILDSYAEVDGEAFCQPCHQKMSAKTFTKAKRRSFGTEKREAATAALKPAWAPKRSNSNAPKSAIDVMHKSWFQNGLKKPAQTSPSVSPASSPSPTPSPSVSPTPHSPNANHRIGSGSYSSSNSLSSSGSPQMPPPRPYSPTHSSSPSFSPTSSQQTSPQMSSTAAKPRQNIPPLMSSTQNGQKTGSWRSSTAAPPQPTTHHEDTKSKTPSWMVSGKPGTPQMPKAPVAKPGGGFFGGGGVSSPYTTRSPSQPHPNGNTGHGQAPSYTSITFEHAPVVRKPGTYRHDSPVPMVSPEGMNLGDILEAILRPLSEDEVGSLAYQAIPLLQRVHGQGRLHDNITHKTIRITSSGTVLLVENDTEIDSKTSESSIKFKAPEPEVSVSSDTYSLGVALWTSADYLLDEEEEPDLTAEFCDFIGLMTDDEPTKRPPLRELLPYVEKFKEISAPLLAALIREVERKKVLRKEIQETTMQKQKTLGKLLLKEIHGGVSLKHIDRNTFSPVQRPPTPQEVMCHYINTFDFRKLKKVDFSKLPLKQFKLNPRERLLNSILEGTHLRKALVVAGYDINVLIAPVPNHPTYGTIFRDISPLFTEPRVYTQIAQQIFARYSGEPPDIFVATPTDGGIFFAALISQLYNRGVVVLQNAGRLPRKMEKYSCSYDTLGYVSHSLELQLQKNLIREGTKVVLIDEMLVNGGILEAARIILKETGAKLKEVLCISELEGFGGRAKLKSFECNVHALYTFNDNSSPNYTKN